MVIATVRMILHYRASVLPRSDHRTVGTAFDLQGITIGQLIKEKLLNRVGFESMAARLHEMVAWLYMDQV